MQGCSHTRFMWSSRLTVSYRVLPLARRARFAPEPDSLSAFSIAAVKQLVTFVDQFFIPGTVEGESLAVC